MNPFVRHASPRIALRSTAAWSQDRINTAAVTWPTCSEEARAVRAFYTGFATVNEPVLPVRDGLNCVWPNRKPYKLTGLSVMMP